MNKKLPFFAVLICFFLLLLIKLCLFQFQNDFDPIFLRILRKIPSEFIVRFNVGLYYPQIYASSIDDQQKTAYLREWIFRTIPRTYEKNPKAKYYYGQDISDIYLYSNLSSTGTDCAGVAYALMRLYRLYGYESYTYHVGDINDYQHAVTLVKIRYEDKQIWSIQDPSYNVGYFDKKKVPYDVRALTKEVVRKKSNADIFLIQGYYKSYPYICTDVFFCDNSSTPFLAPLKKKLTIFLHPRYVGTGKVDAEEYAKTKSLKTSILKSLGLRNFYRD